jgi:hypothetical protein
MFLFFYKILHFYLKFLRKLSEIKNVQDLKKLNYSAVDFRHQHDTKPYICEEN